MKFLLLVCPDETFTATDELAGDLERWSEDVEQRGVLVEGHRLRGTGDATMVRDRGRQIIDGPFAETKEQIAGYDVLDCADLAEAVQFAARHPVARFGAIEVRPFWSE
jgi:hypothetical protein